MSLLGRYLFLKYIIEFMYWTRAAYIPGAQCADVRAVDAENGKRSETGGLLAQRGPLSSRLERNSG